MDEIFKCDLSNESYWAELILLYVVVLSFESMDENLTTVEIYYKIRDERELATLEHSFFLLYKQLTNRFLTWTKLS